MNAKVNEMEINGITYVPKGTEKSMAKEVDGMDYVIVRTYSAGVFAGYLAKQKGQEVIVKNARRLWRWEGAASLSELSQSGVKKPKECKFPCEVPSIKLLNAIEIIPCTNEAQESINGVEVWMA